MTVGELKISSLLEQLDVDGDGDVDEQDRKLAAVLKSMDKDGSGTISLREMVTIGQTRLTNEAKIRNLRWMVAAAVFASLIVSSVLLGLMIAANEASKDDKPDSNGALKTISGVPVSTEVMSTELGLLDLPKLAPEILAKLETIVFTDEADIVHIYRIIGTTIFSQNSMRMVTATGETVLLSEGVLNVVSPAGGGQSRQASRRRLLGEDGGMPAVAGIAAGATPASTVVMPELAKYKFLLNTSVDMTWCENIEPAGAYRTIYNMDECRAAVANLIANPVNNKEKDGEPGTMKPDTWHQPPGCTYHLAGKNLENYVKITRQDSPDLSCGKDANRGCLCILNSGEGMSDRSLPDEAALAIKSWDAHISSWIFETLKSATHKTTGAAVVAGLRAKGVTISDLVAVGFPDDIPENAMEPHFWRKGFSWKNLEAAGYSAREWVEFGGNATDGVHHGWDPKVLRAEGFTALDFLKNPDGDVNLGREGSRRVTSSGTPYTVHFRLGLHFDELAKAGFNASEVLDAYRDHMQSTGRWHGYNRQIFIALLADAKELLLPNEHRDLLELGFDVKDLAKAGCNFIGLTGMRDKLGLCNCPQLLLDAGYDRKDIYLAYGAQKSFIWKKFLRGPFHEEKCLMNLTLTEALGYEGENGLKAKDMLEWLPLAKYEESNYTLVNLLEDGLDILQVQKKWRRESEDSLKNKQTFGRYLFTNGVRCDGTLNKTFSIPVLEPLHCGVREYNVDYSGEYSNDLPWIDDKDKTGAITLKEAFEGGFSGAELMKCARTFGFEIEIDRLRFECGFGAKDLEALGYKLKEEQHPDNGLYSDAKHRGYTPGNMLNFPIAELLKLGYQENYLKYLGVSPWRWQSAGYSVEKMKQMGFDTFDMSMIWTAKSMRKAGYTASELAYTSAYSKDDMLQGGFKQGVDFQDWPIDKTLVNGTAHCAMQKTMEKCIKVKNGKARGEVWSEMRGRLESWSEGYDCVWDLEVGCVSENTAERRQKDTIAGRPLPTWNHPDRRGGKECRIDGYPLMKCPSSREVMMNQVTQTLDKKIKPACAQLKPRPFCNDEGCDTSVVDYAWIKKAGDAVEFSPVTDYDIDGFPWMYDKKFVPLLVKTPDMHIKAIEALPKEKQADPMVQAELKYHVMYREVLNHCRALYARGLIAPIEYFDVSRMIMIWEYSAIYPNEKYKKNPPHYESSKLYILSNKEDTPVEVWTTMGYYYEPPEPPYGGRTPGMPPRGVPYKEPTKISLGCEGPRCEEPSFIWSNETTTYRTYGGTSTD
mmetsp:Transcript_19293/g.23038  ORF Transcript_19293/g.23038 Transcript_19293/m.23038 type:complete len:1269 (+) Transcript_19293:123-3929(+)|eukprot:CAMPEP_0197861286 /NCGR_PEP_ID=MMETSP1438-20131217/37227_1 /TAXON_ID=1461541 /ORGANISM="Pterosperma sp., Strain CCMP1384" /LENGTH=1268 /DNA_ID=CAMNT_0043478411 /DNA_START=122 /DNA_END=3928 /DNA_ORIENTATION=+